MSLCYFLWHPLHWYLCISDINECENDGLCQNGGTCKNSQGSYTCDCAAGFAGQQCGSGKWLFLHILNESIKVQKWGTKTTPIHLLIIAALGMCINVVNIIRGFWNIWYVI